MARNTVTPLRISLLTTCGLIIATVSSTAPVAKTASILQLRARRPLVGQLTNRAK